MHDELAYTYRYIIPSISYVYRIQFIFIVSNHLLNHMSTSFLYVYSIYIIVVSSSLNGFIQYKLQ